MTMSRCTDVDSNMLIWINISMYYLILVKVINYVVYWLYVYIKVISHRYDCGISVDWLFAFLHIEFSRRFDQTEYSENFNSMEIDW